VSVASAAILGLLAGRPLHRIWPQEATLVFDMTPSWHRDQAGGRSSRHLW